MPVRNVEDEFDILKSDFGKLSSDLGRLTEAVQSLVGQDVQACKVKLQGVMGQVGDGVEEAVSAIGVRGKAGAHCVARQMQDHPVTSLLVCLGLGLAVGKLMSR